MWERHALPLGAYRLMGVSLLDKIPDTDGYIDCTNDPQFADELMCAKQHTGLTGGIWAGMMLDMGATAIVLALLLEQ